METGRRFGNQVGDPIASSKPDIRGDSTANGFSCGGLQPTPVSWRGVVLPYLNGKKGLASSSDPFFLPAPSARRIFLEFFLAGPANGGEDCARYLRSIPGDRVEIRFARASVDQKSFAVYQTAGLTAVPDQLLETLQVAERATGTTTAAEFHYVSPAFSRGGRSFQVRPLDAAGNERTGCTILTAVLAPWPLPPTGVEVHAYSAHAGLVTLKWSKAADDVTGDSYRVFRSISSGARVSYATAVKSATSPVAVTGSPAKSYATCALGVTGAAASGVWLLAVRHKSGSIEEDNVSALARFVVSDRGRFGGSGFPFRPTFIAVTQSPGGRLVVHWKHDNAGEPNPTLRFKVYRGQGGGEFFDHIFFDPAFFSTPSALLSYATAVAMVARGNGRFFEGTAGFVLTDGLLYRFAVRSEATGGLREVNTAFATAVADATPPASCPSSLSIAKVLA